MADADTTINPADKREINLLLCEVLKSGWSVEELAKLIQGINEAKAPELPHGEEFAVKVLTDGIVTLGQHQAALVTRIERLLGVSVEMTAVDFPIFDPPPDSWSLSQCERKKPSIDDVSEHGRRLFEYVKYRHFPDFLKSLTEEQKQKILPIIEAACSQYRENNIPEEMP